MNTLIKARELGKIYIRGAEEIKAVDLIDLDIEQGEFIAFVGPSGSGKTTLLHLLGCLDNPSSGELHIDGTAVFSNGKTLKEGALTRLRSALFGYVFQKFYLIPSLSVMENILLPGVFNRRAGQKENAYKISKRLGLENRLNHLPREISGGEMQRVAIARALLNEPKILLADEPTGNLDSIRSREIAQIITDLNSEKGITVILVTHNPELAAKASRVIELIDGHLQ